LRVCQSLARNSCGGAQVVQLRGQLQVAGTGYQNRNVGFGRLDFSSKPRRRAAEVNVAGLPEQVATVRCAAHDNPILADEIDQLDSADRAVIGEFQGARTAMLRSFDAPYQHLGLVVDLVLQLADLELEILRILGFKDDFYLNAGIPSSQLLGKVTQFFKN
jgi:hypothetical protein